VTTDRSEKLKQVEVEERSHLTRLLDPVQRYSRRHLLIAATIILLPVVFGIAFDGIGRLVVDRPEPFPIPWQQPEGPWPGLEDRFEEDGWGDLLYLARLPYYEALMDPDRDRGRRLSTDEAGFPNHPSGGPTPPIDGDFDAIVTGASFMALASSVDLHFGAQLANALGGRVYNSSWWGAGPVRGLLYTITRPNFGQRPDQLLVWGIIERDLMAKEFRPVFRELSDTGDVIPIGRSRQAIELVKRLRSWNVLLGQYLEATSVARDWSRKIAFALPTVALDRGATSQVQVAELTRAREVRRMLFFEPAIASAYLDYEERGGDEIIAAIERVAARCSAAGVRMVVLLIPDKYAVFREHLDRELYPRNGLDGDSLPRVPEQRATALLQKGLHAAGIEAIDLYPYFVAAQFEQDDSPMLYRVDDTHWSEEGIRVAVGALMEQLENPPEQDVGD